MSFGAFSETKLISSTTHGIVVKTIENDTKQTSAIKSVPIREEDIDYIRNELCVLIKAQQSPHFVKFYEYSIEENFFYNDLLYNRNPNPLAAQISNTNIVFDYHIKYLLH